jgi:uncharacterized membrane protein YedE/YeeE
VTLRQRCVRAFALACIVEFPLAIAFSTVGNQQHYNVWQRIVVLFHALSFGILSELVQGLESPTGNSVFDSHPNVYFFFFFSALFIFQSIMLAAIILPLQRIGEALRGKPSRIHTS